MFAIKIIHVNIRILRTKNLNVKSTHKCVAIMPTKTVIKICENYTREM